MHDARNADQGKRSIGRRESRRPYGLVGAIGAAALVVASLTALSVPAHAAPCTLPPGQLKKADLPQGSSAVACKAVGRKISLNGAVLTVPGPGMGAGTEEFRPNGDHRLARISVAADGTVAYPAGEDVLPSTSSEGYGPDGCDDPAWTDNDVRWDEAYRWYIGDGARPTSMSTDTVVSVLRSSIQTITGASGCGRSDTVSATASYGGITTHESEMSTADGYSACQSFLQVDVYSTVDFGNLDDNGHPPLAKACWWYYSDSGRDSMAQVDIRFNVHDFAWTNNPFSGCGKYDLQSVAVHEFGHAYGLGHVSENGHKYLTMSTDSQVCSSYGRSLGLGDIIGLQTIY